MRRLLHDIRSHRFSVLVFVAYWLAMWAFTYLTWRQPAGMAPAAAVLFFLAPVLAGAVVGWWGSPTGVEPLGARAAFTARALAGVCVMVTDVALIFIPDARRDLRHGELKSAGIGEWLIWSIALGTLAVVLGLIGTLVGAAVARWVRVQPPKR